MKRKFVQYRFFWRKTDIDLSASLYTHRELL